VEIEMLGVQRFLAKKSLAQLQEEFSIKVRYHEKYPNLVSLAYDQLKSPMSRPIVQECRGLVIDLADSNRVVSMAYKKFWNYGEVHGDELNLNTTRLYCKEDGSLVCMYYYQGEWLTSTTGTPDASGICDMWGGSFNSLFWHVWEELGYELPKDTNYCYVFELCSAYNQVVVSHQKRRVLHGVRNLADGCGGYELAPESAAEMLGLNYELVKIYDLPKTWPAITQFIREQKGLEFEGLVAVDHQFHRLKLKNAEYVFLHHSLSRFSLKHALEIIFTGEVSEVIAYKPEYQVLFDDLSRTYFEIKTLTEQYLEQCKDKARKDIGLWFNTLPETEANGFIKSYVFNKLFKPEFEFVSVEAALLNWFNSSSAKVKRLFKLRPDLQTLLISEEE
jgi:RNA ligase